MQKNGERYAYVTDMKMVSLCLVFLWHCSLFYEDNPYFPDSSGIISGPLTVQGKIINVTLVAAFIFASGFLFGHMSEKTDRTAADIILRRIRRLLVPYYVCGTILLVPIYTFFDLKAFGRPDHAGYAEGMKCMLLGEFSENLWFLWMCFWVVLFFTLLLPLVRKRRFVILFILTLAAAITVDVFLKDFPYFKLSQTAPYLICFFVGILFYSFNEKISALGHSVYLLLALAAFVPVVLYVILGPSGFWVMYIVRPCGALSLFFLFRFLDGNKIWKFITSTNMYCYLEKNSMMFYIFDMGLYHLYFRLFFPAVGQHPYLCVALMYIHCLFAMTVLVHISKLIISGFLYVKGRIAGNNG